MARPHGTDALGRPVDLIGEPLGVRPAPEPGLRITKETDDMAKAERSGVYTLNGRRFYINAGDTLPDGAEMDAAEQRAEPKAPENRAEKAAPENRAKKAD